jgi:hypothetical protein
MGLDMLGSVKIFKFICKLGHCSPSPSRTPTPLLSYLQVKYEYPHQDADDRLKSDSMSPNIEAYINGSLMAIYEERGM